ncbi:helix-turn-helix transcriptional regulator [Clostridium felsineum]|uniref:HTH-type transcriptional activator RhaR n=1 Tax=Clostridium felsineum TaxID=36839 RepID=A0A1S8MHQ2_9CLOT|nr:AraC family transcriptional regulator [Clostridium felsineum]URZ07058.1 HTH-type transcriptional activator RhaR [Clostridium felsineum]URZ12088.1 HTH-type transcriptional activator RhaR [Clostridium felsineum]
MENQIAYFYKNILTKKGFFPIESNNKFNSCGQTFALSNELGEGFYWIYSEANLFDIRIHDFYFHEDYLFECMMPECMSISYYKSIAGHEINPYKRMNANCIRTYIGGKSPYKSVIHKLIPVKSIGIEILPAYYINYLKEKYPDYYINPYEAFCSIDEIYHFPEMKLLLNQAAEYGGNGISAKLFYEAKVNEAVSLVVEYFHKYNKEQNHVSANDKEQIKNVTSYINDHAVYSLTLNQLSRIACMGQTKLKKTFKQVNGCTVTEYIQQARIGQAEVLLSTTNLSIAQIAKTVGYSNASRFAELFQRNVGILPGEYRKIVN